MNPNAQKWVDALRSNSYAQTIGSLRDSSLPRPVGYCCHGVACDLYPKGTFNEEDYYFVLDGLIRVFTMPPDEVQEWLGIDEEFAEALATANDSGKSFSEIADMIETHFNES